MRTDISTYVDFREVNGGAPSSLEEFQTTFQKFPRNLVLRMCSVLKSHIASWTGTYTPKAQARLLPGFFPKEIADYMKLRAGPSGLHMFERKTGWNVLVDEVRSYAPRFRCSGRVFGRSVNCEQVPLLPAGAVALVLDDSRRIPYLLVRES